MLRRQIYQAGRSLALFFDVNEKQKTLTIRLNNDDLREPSETLTLSITDPTNTSQIVNDTASVIVRDDDPSTPEIVFDRSEYVMSEGGTQYLDDVSLDYFDTSQSTYFKLDWDDGGGTLKTTHAGSDYTQGTWVDYFTMQTSLLRNLEFTAGTSVEGFATVTLTAAEYDSQSGLPTVGGRTANTEFNFTFDVHKTPALDGTDIAPSGAKDYSQLTGYAGVDLSIPGVTITDIDSEFVSVNVSSNISGVLSTTSTANFTTVRPCHRRSLVSPELKQPSRARSMDWRSWRRISRIPIPATRGQFSRSVSTMAIHYMFAT